MTLSQIPWRLPVFIAMVVGLAFVTRHCGPSPDPSAPYRQELARMAHQHSLDSAEAVAAYQQAVYERDSLVKVAGTSFTNASRYHRIADSLARLPRYQPPAVPVSPCDSALALTMAERDTLRSALDTMTAAYGRQHDAYRGAVEAASAAYTGMMKAEGALSLERSVWSDERESWRSTVARLKPCKVLGLIGCPTITAGFGAMLSGGRLVTGPVVSVGIPVRIW